MQKNIHQIWVGPYRMPEREQRFVARMRETHPGYTHFLWTDDNMPAMPPQLQERFDWRMSQKDYAFAADIARVYLVWLFGGVYIDVDTEVRRGLPVFAASTKALFRHHQDADPSFSNDLIGMEKGDPLGLHLLNTMVAPAYDFGPHWLGYTVKAYLGVDKDAPHWKTGQALSLRSIIFWSDDDWNERFVNHSLFSWSAENRERFERENMQ